MEHFEVVNLSKYQHYSNRDNVWIKWYQKSLDDWKFQQLTDSERWLFVGVVMLAVQTNNDTLLDPLHIRNRVCNIGGKGVSKVRAGLQKMIDLGLLRIKNASIEYSRTNKKRSTTTDSSLLTTDKLKHTDSEWKKILHNWRQKGNKTLNNKKIVIKKDKSQWLVDQQGKWEIYK